MLAKNYIMDQIIEIIVGEKEFIEKKSKLGLFDDNKHWENIVRKLLNDCLGYELENLNMDNSNYPGIDLGDRSNSIGIQVTTIKTSAKIKNTLEKMMNEKVYEEFKNLKVFILGDKQDSYTVDLQPYEDKIHFNIDDDVWDFQDLLKFLNNMNATDLFDILNFLKKECRENNNNSKDNSEPAAMVILNYLNDMRRLIEEIAVEGKAYTEIFLLKDAEKMCADVVRLLSAQEYIMLSQLFENIGSLSAEVNRSDTKSQGMSSYRLKYYANAVLQKWEIYDVLCLKYNAKRGYLFNLIVDMDTFESRINSMGIDFDIIQQQFSMDNFRGLLEKIKKQSCENIIVLYKDESELLKKIAQSKNVILEQYEDKETSVKRIFDIFKKKTKDFVMLTNDINLVSVFNEYRAEELKIMGVNLGDDLHWKLKGQFFDIIELESEKDDFFSYNEEKYYDIRSLTKADYRKMVSNASNKVDHQLRVSKGGEVWMSRVVAAEEISDLQFRWETYDAYNGYTGPKAASDEGYINETYNELKWDWDNGERGFIDLWLAPSGIYT